MKNGNFEAMVIEESIAWMLTNEKPTELYEFDFKSNKMSYLCELDMLYDRYSICMKKYKSALFILPFDGDFLYRYDLEKGELSKVFEVDEKKRYSCAQIIDGMLYCFCRDCPKILCYDLDFGTIFEIDYSNQLNLSKRQEGDMYCCGDVVSFNGRILWTVFNSNIMCELKERTENVKAYDVDVDEKLQLMCSDGTNLYMSGDSGLVIYVLDYDKKIITDTIKLKEIETYGHSTPFLKLIYKNKKIIIIPFQSNKVFSLKDNMVHEIDTINNANTISNIAFYSAFDDGKDKIIGLNFSQDTIWEYNIETDIVRNIKMGVDDDFLDKYMSKRIEYGEVIKENAIPGCSLDNFIKLIKLF